MEQPDAALFAETTLESRTVFEGRLLRLRVDTVRLPGGGTSTREIVEHPGAAAVVALHEDGSICLVRQWRHPIAQVTLEIPAGVVGPGEDAPDAARRELAEETNLAAESIVPLIETRVSVGYSDELIRIFLARGLSRTEGAPDEDENLEVVRLPLVEAIRLCLDGRIVDAKSIVALLALQCLATDGGDGPATRR